MFLMVQKLILIMSARRTNHLEVLAASSLTMGTSRENAIKRLTSIGRKFAKAQELQAQYKKFMQEYQDLGHMTEVTNDKGKGIVNYLPHHSVIKADSLTTNLIVVFDASSPISTGIALHDIIRVGPTIQQDRLVVWRNDPSTPIRDYRFNTVTYGLASAPFLAIRCLIQLAIESREQYPEASEVIRNDFYDDDLLYGGDDVRALRRLKIELTEILKSAGFTLHKWNSNEPSILDSSSESTTLPIGDEIKTLGVCWNPTDDYLQYRTQAVTKSRQATKKSVLSTTAQIYDPLGLMGPTIICAKIIPQQLWQLKIGWDESLPLDLHTTLTRYQDQTDDMSLISIPRHVICTEPQSIEMYGFCDASEAAYGACIYLKSLNKSGQVSVHLICAKSRVAPLKRITIPRLELCGALLLRKLGRTVQQALSVKIDSIHYWSDSTITLAWINHRPEELQTFVANRVADIQRSALEAQWAHVKSEDNPADVISRGTTPENLKNSQLWWFQRG
ncbi:uncharacterized protein LOC124412769 [Diprion similis]|uniref:uncharacterized protein LOC124412769 n=1 Tax=Diprion similis TaxID=362088 RepID=UPI001EF98717|nr:uncharacterized protein LOC124412769 [Diprion similis]